jgi:rhodanese-related sulfurtransferase
MKRLLFLPVLLALAFGQSRTLTVEEIEKALENKEVFFLDVREPKEIAELGSVKGYVNIPLGQLESRLSEIPKDKLILTA